MSDYSPFDLHAEAMASYQERDWQKALDLSIDQLRRTPRHARSCYLAGLACLQMRQWRQAADYLGKASWLEPMQADYATQYARALSIISMPGEALRAANRAASLFPDKPTQFDVLGTIYLASNAFERAVEAFRRAVAMAPSNSAFRYNHAVAAMYVGDFEIAQAELEASLAIDPENWRAHYVLSRFQRQTLTSNHIDRLQSLAVQQGRQAVAQMYLHMALGKEYEDLEEYAKAFDHFTRGKAIARSMCKASIQRDEQMFNAIIRAFPDPNPSPTGFPTDEPIFVVGMPRSGTTLVERIISSHPYVYSAGELKNFGAVLKRVSDSRGASMLDLDILAKVPYLQWARLGEDYLASTRPMTDGKPYFIDKFPHNFLYIGFIANALPRAKIVCLRRNPMDTCLSNFRELFGLEAEFTGYSSDLLDIGRYYLLFDRLMAHWKRVFPERILEVRYESLVDAQEAGTRKLLEYCDLPWSEACLHFERNPAPVATASSVQVRAPLYRTAVRRWKKYEKSLVELRELLVREGINCD